MDVMIEITRKIHLYEVLQTPSGRSQFEIYHIDPDRVVIKTKSGTIISIPASYVAPILERAGIVEINGNRPAKLRLRR